MISPAIRVRAWILYALGVVIFTSLVIQFSYGFSHATNIETYTEQFFSFFTVLSNIFIGTTFCLVASNTLRGMPPTQSFESFRGAATFCILTTGITYTFFLRGPGAEEQFYPSLSLINSIFHHYIPTIALLDWIMVPPRFRVNWSTTFSWLGITMVYLVLVEIAGGITHSYPYFFVDPTMLHGYGGVVRASAGFLPFFLVFALVIITTANVPKMIRKPKKR